jgi:pyruvate formate lyase activating enzyme
MSEGEVSAIEHYAVHDGPGIRTIVFLKGCPLECLWCCNPEARTPYPELRHHASRCAACHACGSSCPSGAVRRGTSGPVFDRRACANCSAWPCVEACVHGALEKVGSRVSAEEVVERITADLPFYRNSHGGATFSGGEPFAQPVFLEELLRSCRSLGIHTAVETCGHVPGETFLRLAPLVDLFLYDVKAVDPERHEALTGAFSERVLSNLAALAGRGSDGLLVRVPVVPECTGLEENLRDIASFLVELGIPRVELMPYHELGLSKYEGLGRPYPLPPIGPDRVGRSLVLARSVFFEAGLACEEG